MADEAADVGAKEAAVWRLARRLHWKMEQLDPTESSEWEALSERERDFYRHCIDAVLAERALVHAVISDS